MNDPLKRKIEEEERLDSELAEKKLALIKSLQELNDARDKTLEIIKGYEELVKKSHEEFFKFILDNNPQIKLSKNDFNK